MVAPDLQLRVATRMGADIVRVNSAHLAMYPEVHTIVDIASEAAGLALNPPDQDTHATGRT